MKYPLPFAAALHPRFRTKAGWLTPYALACGYRERAESASGECATLWTDITETPHVRHNAADGTPLVWDSPKTLTDARKLFRSIVSKF